MYFKCLQVSLRSNNLVPKIKLYLIYFWFYSRHFFLVVCCVQLIYHLSFFQYVVSISTNPDVFDRSLTIFSMPPLLIHFLCGFSLLPVLFPQFPKVSPRRRPLITGGVFVDPTVPIILISHEIWFIRLPHHLISREIFHSLHCSKRK